MNFEDASEIISEWKPIKTRDGINDRAIEAFNAAIWALKEVEKMQWIKVCFGEPTEEEKEVYPDIGPYLDFSLPEEGQEILITTAYTDSEGNRKLAVSTDICEYDYEGYYLESGRSWLDVIAWMPFPEPYKEEET